ncbi:MAG: response regulator [Oscillospiraceae bacterium]|nr:response regulator [Oscillospiraceae bacterium]
MTKKKIILVDDSPANLTACKKTLKDIYDVYPAPNAEKMFETLKHVIPDLILLDVEMPVMNGYEAMRMLKRFDEYENIPVIFLSAMDDAQSEMEGLELGAVDYIHKPFVSALLLKRIETHIAVLDGKKELLELNRSIEELLTRKTNADISPADAGNETIRELLSKVEVLTKTGHNIRAPINAIINLIENAAKSDDIERIKQCLADADVEARLILEITNDILDIPVNK